METTSAYINLDKKGHYTGSARDHLYKIKDEKIATIAPQLAKGVACLILDSGQPLQGTPLQLSAGEKFRHQPQLGYGTAFLIGKKHILTAGHCVRPLTEMKVAFNFQKVVNHQTTYPLSPSDLYGVKKIVALVEYDGLDVAILELDRETEGQEPLALSVKDVKEGQEIYALGHGEGLPITCCYNSEVKKSGEGHTTEYLFEGNLDTFHGHSGSPVIDKTAHKVVGIVVAGNDDYLKGSDGSDITPLTRKRVTLREKISFGFERCVRISEVAKILYKDKNSLPEEVRKAFGY